MKKNERSEVEKKENGGNDEEDVKGKKTSV